MNPSSNEFYYAFHVIASLIGSCLVLFSVTRQMMFTTSRANGLTFGGKLRYCFFPSELEFYHLLLVFEDQDDSSDFPAWLPPDPSTLGMSHISTLFSDMASIRHFALKA